MISSENGNDGESSKGLPVTSSRIEHVFPILNVTQISNIERYGLANDDHYFLLMLTAVS